MLLLLIIIFISVTTTCYLVEKTLNMHTFYTTYDNFFFRFCTPSKLLLPKCLLDVSKTPHFSDIFIVRKQNYIYSNRLKLFILALIPIGSAVRSINAWLGTLMLQNRFTDLFLPCKKKKNSRKYQNR